MGREWCKSTRITAASSAGAGDLAKGFAMELEDLSLSDILGLGCDTTRSDGGEGGEGRITRVLQNLFRLMDCFSPFVLTGFYLGSTCESIDQM